MPGRNQPRSRRGRSAIARTAMNTNSTNGLGINNGGGMKKGGAHPSATGFMRSKPWQISVPAFKKNYTFKMNVSDISVDETLDIDITTNDSSPQLTCSGTRLPHCEDASGTNDCSSYYSSAFISDMSGYEIVQCQKGQGNCVADKAKLCTPPPPPPCRPAETAYQSQSCYFIPSLAYGNSAKPCNMYVGFDVTGHAVKCDGPDASGYCSVGDWCSDTSCNYGECSNGSDKGCYLDSSNYFCCTNWSKEHQGCRDSKSVCKMHRLQQILNYVEWK